MAMSLVADTSLTPRAVGMNCPGFSPLSTARSQSTARGLHKPERAKRLGERSERLWSAGGTGGGLRVQGSRGPTSTGLTLSCPTQEIY
jgi:hypothetical protein